MWCTRWFMPLLLLPLPNAPPYFIIVFLLSLTMHSRPCIYCIVLLSTLFVSSCYWSPIPTSALLTVPWADNITTFSEAIVASLNTSLSHNITIPSHIRPLDRCWCDLAAGDLFKPFNTTRWEHASVYRVKCQLEQEAEAVLAQQVSEAAETVPEEASQAQDAFIEPTPLLEALSEGMRIWYKRLRDGYADFGRASPSTASPSSKKLDDDTTRQNLPPFRKVYDLRRHGMDLIVDFGWSRDSY